MTAMRRITCRDCGGAYETTARHVVRCEACRPAAKLRWSRATYKAHPRAPRTSEHYKAKRREYRLNSTEKNLLNQARYRAKKAGLEFNLTVEDVAIPAVCPYFQTPLAIAIGEKGPRYGSPTLDRIDNSKGYIKGNVEVISYRANSMKSHLTLKEMALVALAFLERSEVRR